MVKLVARTWEWTGTTWKLVLDHVFYGDTQAEAKHIFDAHMQSDRFLSGCVELGKFEGRVICHTDTWFEDAVPSAAGAIHG